MNGTPVSNRTWFVKKIDFTFVRLIVGSEAVHTS